MILNKIRRNRRNFDVNSEIDIAEFKFYIQNNRWSNGCPFEVEYPHVSIPDMIKDKLVKKFLEV